MQLTNWLAGTVAWAMVWSTAGAQPTPADPLAPARQLLGQQRFAEAEGLLRTFVDQQPEDGRGWYFLGYTLHAQNRLDEALVMHLKAAEFPGVKVNGLYNAACVYARQNKTDEAFATLQLAIDAGFQNWGNLINDTDFANIRNDDRFQKLLPKLLEGDDLFREPARILQTFAGEAANDQFGWVARRIGDVDGDGAQDFVTTAPTAAANAGKIYVYSSRSGQLLYQRTGARGERLGNGAAGAGDVNADGIPDVIVGAPGGNAAYVLAGHNGEVIWKFSAPQPGSSFGYKVSGAGDVDGDGHAEVVVTATQVGGPGAPATGPGQCVVYSGKTGQALYSLDGERTGDQFGSAVAGSQESPHRLLAVGAQDAGPQQRGRVYVYHLEAHGASLAFRIEGDAGSQDLGKMFVSFPGDFNQDGVPDVYASDFADSSTAPGSGRIRVVSGTDGSPLLSVTGRQPGEGLGTSPSDTGDVNSDGIPDLVIGAWQNAEAAPSGGKVTLVSGADASVLATWTCRQPGDTFGFDAVGLGDVDGDGHVDFLLTSAWSPVLGPRTGRVFIIAGRAWPQP